MPRRSSDYQIEIPVSIRDNTKSGAKTVVSNTEAMAEKAAKAAQSAADKATREVEKAEKAKLSAFERRIRAIDQIQQAHNRSVASSVKAQQQAVEKAEKAKQSAAEKSLRAIDRAQKSASKERENRIKAEQRAVEKAERDSTRAAQASARAFEKAERDKANAARQTAAKIEEYNATMSSRWSAGWAAMKGIALAALVAIGAGFYGLMNAIDRAATFERLEQGLAAIMGSSAGAKEEIVKLKEVAKVPGLGFREAIQGSLALQALGFEADRSRKILTAFGNAVAFTGGKAELDRIILQVSQMAAAGKVLMADLRPIIQTAPIAARALKDVFGTIDPKQLNEMTGNNIDVFIDKWVEGMLKLAKAPDAAANAFENLGDSWDRFLVAIGKPFLGPVQGAINALTPSLEALGNKIGDVLTTIKDQAVEMWKGLPPSTKAAFADMINTVQAQGQRIIDWFTSNYGAIQDIVRSALNGIAQFWATYGDNIKGIMSSFTTSIIAIMNMAVSIMQGDWKRFGESLGAFLISNLDRIRHAVSLIVRVIIDVLLLAVPQIVPIGFQIGVGLVDGIIAALEAKSRSITQAIVGAVAPGYALYKQLTYQGPGTNAIPGLNLPGLGMPKPPPFANAPTGPGPLKPPPEKELTSAEQSKIAKAARDAEIISSMRESMTELAAEFNETFNKALPLRFGQTALHSKLNYDHRAAADISIDPRSAEGKFVLDWLSEHGINARASLGPEVSKTTGKVISTGRHIHAGELSGAMGRGLKMREGLLSPKALKEQTERYESDFYGMSPKEITDVLASERARTPLTTTAGEDSGMTLPTKLTREWDTYYEHIKKQEDELRDRRQDQAVEYATAQRALVVEIGHAELDLAQFRRQMGDDQFSEQRRALSAKQEELDLLKRITAAEDERANGPLNESLRIQLALIEDINAIRKRDEDAIKDYNRALLEMADSTVYHAQQADTAVAKFLAGQKSVTDIVVDAKIGVMQLSFDLMDRGLSKVTSKLGIMSSLVHDLIMGFLKLAASQFFKSVFLGQGGSSAGGGGGIIGSIFGGGGGGSTGGGGGGLGMIIKNLIGGGGGPGGNITSPAATPGINPVIPNPRSMSTILQSMGLPGGAAAAGSKGLLSSFGSSIAPMLPFMGAGLGASLGGQSMAGSILGGAGGLLAGGMGMAAILGTTTGVFAAGGSMAFLAPLLTNPITAIAAAALIAGALIMKKNKERQMAEQVRNTAGIDARTSVYQLLADAQTGDVSVSEARKRWEEIHQQYLQQISGIKDSKTRNNALLWWDHISGTKVDPGGATVALWPMIEAAAKESEKRGNVRNRMSPIFSGGGVSHQSQMIKVRPGEGIKYPGSTVIHTVFGRDLGYDSQYMYAPKGTRIINQSDMRSAPGFQSGGVVGGNSAASSEPNELHIDSLELNLDQEGLATVVIKSKQFKKATIRNVKIGKLEKKLA